MRTKNHRLRTNLVNYILAASHLYFFNKKGLLFAFNHIIAQFCDEGEMMKMALAVIRLRKT